ncbi:hypothetical protein FDECE_6498 [Fusarium decemcellulare]|nr:hypothetical protein FDECE_6498 [Fusarium decemcellulare]
MEDQPDAPSNTRRLFILSGLYAIGNFAYLLSGGLVMMVALGIPSIFFHTKVLHAWLSSVTFGTLFRFIPFATTRHGPRPLNATFAGGFCYLHLIPFGSRMITALRLGAYPTGASLYAYISRRGFENHNVTHLGYEAREGILHFRFDEWKPFNGRRTPLDLLQNAHFNVPGFESIRVGGSPARCRNIQPSQT